MIKQILIIGLCLICLVLAYFAFFRKKPVQEDPIVQEMIKKNQAVVDSMNTIIADLNRKDSLINIQRDSLNSQLEIIKALSDKLMPKLDDYNKKVNSQLISWDKLEDSQKDSMINLVVNKYRR